MGSSLFWVVMQSIFNFVTDVQGVKKSNFQSGLPPSEVSARIFIGISCLRHLWCMPIILANIL